MVKKLGRSFKEIILFKKLFKKVKKKKKHWGCEREEKQINSTLFEIKIITVRCLLKDKPQAITLKKVVPKK